MIEMYLNGRANREFTSWDEVMDFMWELLGQHPEDDMKSDILTGKEIFLGGNRYQFDEGTDTPNVLQPWEMFGMIRAA